MTDETEIHESETDFEVVYTANGEVEAQAIRAALVAAGIPASIKMEAAQQLFAVTVDGLGAVKVLVPADRADEARDVIANPVESDQDSPVEGESSNEVH
jgi:hypothetical protein